MWKSLSPTLLALIVGSAAPTAQAATNDERDQTALAVASLIEKDLRIPAKRWLDRWVAGKYADDGQWIEKALWFRYADHFADRAPKPEAEELTQRLKTLRAELDQASKGKKLSDLAASLMTGTGGALERLKRETIQIMDPNLPPPVVPLVPEKKEQLQRLLKNLADQATADFEAASAKVSAHAAGPEKQRWDMKDEDPKAQEIDNDSVQVRVEALQNLITAHSVLRDAALRGKDFSIDPTEAKAWLRQRAKSCVDQVYQWDFTWGQANAYLHFYCLVLMSEAYKQGVRDVKDGKLLQPLKLDDLEDGLRSVIYTDMKPYDNPQWRNEIYSVRIRAIDHFLRWCIEMGDARSLKRGAEVWRDFLDLTKRESALSLSLAPKALLIDRGFLNFTAARLMMTRKDLGAAIALVNEVGSAPNMHAGVKDYAKRWTVFISSGGSAGSAGGSSADAWGQPSTVEDPGAALVIARELFNSAEATDNASLKLNNRIAAATHLRNAIAGLDAATTVEPFAASAPGIFSLYVNVLSKLGLRQHAAMAGVEGLQRIAARRDQELKAKRPDPWSADDWKSVVNLSRNTYRIAQGVYARNRGFGPITESARNLLTVIDPKADPASLALEEIIQLRADGKHEDAIERCAEFLRRFPADKYPAEELTVFAALTSARLALLDRLASATDQKDAKDRIVKIAGEMDRDNQAMRSRIETQLADQNIDLERRTALQQARSTILSAEISQLMRDEKYDEVQTRLGDDFWKRPPANDGLSASMLSKLCYACYKQFSLYNAKADAKTTVKVDAKVVADAGDRYVKAYDIYTRQSQRLAGKNVDGDLRRGGKALAATFQGLSQMARQYKAGDPRLSDLANAADRAFADLFEPLIDDKTKPEMVRLVADTLWDIGVHDRAAKLYERYRQLLLQNEELQAFKKDGKTMLDGYEAKIAVRPEFKTKWAAIADLAWDSPNEREAAANGDVVKNTVNYNAALKLLRTFRTEDLGSKKSVMDGKLFADTVAAVESFDRLLVAARSDETVTFNLATAYREAGDMAQALPLLLDLYKQDPTNSKYATGFVEATLKAVKDGNISEKDPKGKAQLVKARDIVAQVRDDLARDFKNRDGYWLAFIQGLELTAALNETAKINETLKFLRVNKSDLSRELVKPGIEANGTDGKPLSDDLRAHRPRNGQAVQLAQRYLDLFTLNGITEKPSFRIDGLPGLTPPKVLVDAGAPAFALVPVKDENLIEMTILKPADAAAAPSDKPADK